MTRDLVITMRAGEVSDAAMAEALRLPRRGWGESAAKMAARYEADHPEAGPFLPQLPCMLARNFKDLSVADKARMLADPAWIAEEKYDGCRAKLHVGPAGNRLDTRNLLPATAHYHEITANVPHLAGAAMPATAGTVLDGELLMPGTDSRTATIVIATAGPEAARELQRRRGPCGFVAFDCMVFRGRDIRALSFAERRRALEEVVTAAHAAGLLRDELRLSPIVEIRQAAALFARVTAAGREGVMLKRLDAPYSLHHSRRVAHQLKWKVARELDGFVTGFTPGDSRRAGTGLGGLVGALRVSVYDVAGRVREIAAVQPATAAERKLAMARPREYIGRCVEIRFQRMTGYGRCLHAVFSRWRPDKSHRDCVCEDLKGRP